MKNDEREDMTKGKKEKEGSDLFFCKKRPPPSPSLSFFFPLPLFLSPEVYETKRNETKRKKMSVYTRPPFPPPATDGPIFPSLDIAGYGRGSLQKKKKRKNLLGWLVGSFLFRIASSIIVTFFFFFFGVLSSNCSFAFFVHLQLS